MADEKKQDERQRMEVGGTGTATVKFKDSFGKDVKAKTVNWASNGSLSITPDEKDPATAKFFASGPGPATIRAEGEGEEGGHAEARIEILVMDKDQAAEGEITVTVQAAPPKKKPEKVEDKPAEKHATTHHT